MVVFVSGSPGQDFNSRGEFQARLCLFQGFLPREVTSGVQPSYRRDGWTKNRLPGAT